MSDIIVQYKSQVIMVDPASNVVSVVSAGPPGVPGPLGPPGPAGPPGSGSLIFAKDTEEFYIYQASAGPMSLSANIQTAFNSTIMDVSDGDPSWGYWDTGTDSHFVITEAGLYTVYAYGIIDSSGSSTGRSTLHVSGTLGGNEVEFTNMSGQDARLVTQLTALYEVGDEIRADVMSTVNALNLTYAEIYIQKFNIETGGSGGGGGVGTPEVYVEDPSDPGTYVSSTIYIGETDPAIGGSDPYAWIDPTDLGGGGVEELPVGGATGQALTKVSGTDFDVEWTTLASVPTDPSVKAIKGGEETVQTHGNTGSTETIDLANGNVHVVTQDMACTYTFTNPTSSTTACSFTLIMTAVTGAATWPASVNWPSGTAPTLTGRCLITFVTVNGGTDWDGFLAGSGMA